MTRKQSPSPCKKKGIGNSSRSSVCELLLEKRDGFPSCRDCRFQKITDVAVTTYNIDNKAAFPGCLETEEYLTANSLIRYEIREESGLEVLFQGIDKLYGLNSEVMDFVSLESEDLGEDAYEGMANWKLDPKLNINESKVTPATPNTDDEIFDSLPARLSLSKSLTNDIFAARPTNLYESTFRSLFKRGDFNNKSVDIYFVAHFEFYGLDGEDVVELLWKDYTEDKYKAALRKIRKIVKRNSKFASKFEKFLKSLTKKQLQAIRYEWLHEKYYHLTQEQIAKRIGISVDSYQDRLEGAYKKLEKAFPEFKRVARRKAKRSREEIQEDKEAKKEKMLPVYEVMPNGERIEIEIKNDREIKNRSLTPAQWKQLNDSSAIKDLNDLEENLSRAEKVKTKTKDKTEDDDSQEVCLEVGMAHIDQFKDPKKMDEDEVYVREFQRSLN